MTPASTSASSAVAHLTLTSVRNAAPAVAATAVARFRPEASDTSWLTTELHITFATRPSPPDRRSEGASNTEEDAEPPLLSFDPTTPVGRLSCGGDGDPWADRLASTSA